MGSKICILWHCPYPWDVRIEKICRSLVSANYKVSLICRGKNGQQKSETTSGVNIYRIFPPSFYPKQALTFPLFFNPFWTIPAKEILMRIKPDLLIVRDIQLAFLAGKLAKQMRIPVVLDMAENYPAALMVYNNKLYKPFLFKNALVVRSYERLCLHRMSHIIVVSQAQKERLINIGIDRDKISIVMNTPDLHYYSKLKINNINASLNVNKHNNRKKLIYVGYIDAHRGVDVLIRGVVLAVKAIPSLSLTIIGSGTEMIRLQKLTEELNANSYIKFTNWLSFEKVPDYIESSDIGIIPHLKSEHTDTTIPNKLFDYMAFTKPVITSNLNPIVEIVNETGCGKVFKSGDAEDLAIKIIELIKNEEIEQIGKRGFKAVTTKYNWNNDHQVLLNTINNILKKQEIN